MIPTMMNGSRKFARAATTPPRTGPATCPAETAADRMPLANAMRSGAVTWDRYSRVATRLVPPPSPAIARNVISETADFAVAMRKLAPE